VLARAALEGLPPENVVLPVLPEPPPAAVVELPPETVVVEPPAAVVVVEPSPAVVVVEPSPIVVVVVPSPVVVVVVPPPPPDDAVQVTLAGESSGAAAKVNSMFQYLSTAATLVVHAIPTLYVPGRTLVGLNTLKLKIPRLLTGPATDGGVAVEVRRSIKPFPVGSYKGCRKVEKVPIALGDGPDASNTISAGESVFGTM